MLVNCRLSVTDQGLVIPKKWLGGAAEMELRAEDGRLILSPVGVGANEKQMAPYDPDDPIWQWGKNPVDTGLTDASVNHDKYLYDDPHGQRG